MCSSNLRDGTTTNTIPEQPSNCANNDCNRDIRFGMHEDYDYYMNCKYRYRNFGLFTADQNLNGRTARFTRQNPNGNRRGYECPEERDHYPYWQPTPWVDLAVLTNDPTRCSFYQAESENVKGRYYCSLPDKWYHYMVSQGGNGNNGFIPSTPSQCAALNAPSSQMMIYLRAQAMQFASALQTQIANELFFCNSQLSAGATIKTITLAQLEAACPSCPTGFVTHPYSFCKVCIPSSCLASIVVVNSSQYNVTGCPPGSIVDSANNPAYCISSACSQVFSTYAQLVAVDNCRSNFVATNGSLVDSNGLCIPRTAMTADCQSLALTPANWTQAPAHNVSLPFLSPSGPLCVQNPWSRHNHLGNGFGGFTNGLNYTFPSYYQEGCAMRIRYNISTNDYNGMDPQNAGQVNSSLNRPNNDNAARIDIRARYGLPTTDSANPYRNARGYLFKNNPTVQVFDYYQYRTYCADLRSVVPNDPTRCYTDTNVNATNRAQRTAFSGYCPRNYPYLSPPAGAQGTVQCSKDAAGTTTTAMQTTDGDFTLRLAINTAQFGRTFQDRSHKFAMRQRPPVLSAECGDIYSLNVRGKRGNIVQTYPGTEYDFTPNRLHVAVGDCVHPQWTGSNTNPNNNDGQGKEGTDRHNIAQQICIRGEGGLGVAGPGGRGRGGTTWTTALLEPGWEGWVQSAAPTMADMQCPPPSALDHTQVHPYNWQICIQPAPTCTFSTRPYTVTATTRVYGTCPTGSAPDTQNPTVCLTSVCTLVARPANPTSWVSGLDPLDPTALGFNASQIGTPNALRHGCWGMSFPEHLDNSSFLGLTRLDLQHLAILDNMQFGGNMKQLDDAGTYFDLGVRRVRQMGTYTYMCTRNNNFSNRSQKGKVLVSATPENRVLVSATGGTVAVNTQQSFRPTTQTNVTADYMLTIPANCLTAATDVTLATLQSPGSLSAASDFVLIAPTTLSCHVQLPPVTLAPLTPTRSIALAGSIVVKVSIVNSSAVHFTVSSTGFQGFYNDWQV